MDKVSTPPLNALIDEVLDAPVFGLDKQAKQQLLMPVFNALHAHHCAHSDHYHALFNHQIKMDSYAALPYLAVRLFKQLTLTSIAQTEEFKVLRSSGTTGQTPAQVVLDRQTSANQSKALVRIMQQFIGRQRLPMLIIDSPSVLKDKSLFSARGAGIQGMAFFGRKLTYALDDNMQLNQEAISQFCAENDGKAVLVFGFTFMVWAHFIQQLYKQQQTLSLTNGILVHSGGWKKLTDQQVDNPTFKRRVREVTGIARVHNFYGMAEQVGSVFVECERGHLHCPVSANVEVRRFDDLAPCKMNEEGLIQVQSVIPTSYPGYSILTEDKGRLLGEDDCPCGRLGRYFTVAGRLPKAEIRGCSDTGSQP